MPIREYELDLPNSRVVVFRELSVDEFEHLIRAEAGKPGADWEVTAAGLRRSLVAIDGAPVSYQDLIGPRLGERFRVAEMISLRGAWEQVHMPSAEDRDRVKGMRVTAG